MSDAASGGTWTSSNPAVGSISTAGIVAGLTPGTTTITYTLPTTCSITTTVTVNPLPPLNTVTGGGQYCVGGVGVHVGLNGSSSGINYQVIFGGSPVASVGGSGTALDFGLFTAAGTYTVLATDMTTGCTKNMTGSAVVVINPLPAGITGTSNVCVGGTSTLSDATPGGSWSSGNPAIAAIVPGSGLVTGVVSGIVNITYTLGGTGCATSIPFLVNALPGAITGITNLCIGTTTILSGIPGGGSWTSASPFVATVASGTGVVTGVSSGTSVITYTLGSGCSRNVSVVVNPLPTAYGMTGGGTYCNGGLGVHVGIVYSSSGVNYQLMIGGSPVGAALPGSNSGLDFGLRTTPGVYTVTAINPITNCTNSMTGSVTVGVNPLPGIENMTGGGSYCSGGSGIAIGLDHSLPGINYQLFNGTTAVGPVVAGTGAAVTFGLYTTAGTYSATATNAVTGCGSNMNGSATITINPLPTAYAVTGGGHYCAGTTGVHIGLSGSDPGTSYSLFRGTVFVTSVTGAGVPIDFGIFTTAGVYTVNASDGSSCSNNMIGSATVTIDPLPVVYGVTGGGGYCIGGAGVHVGLGFSSTGIDYQLWYGGSNIATVHGSGSGLDFGIQSGSGIYSVIAVNVATGCTVTMSGSASITVNLPPNGYSVTGGGNYCIGTTGVHIGTNLSDPGTNYQLYRGTTPVGAALPGTSAPLDFGTFISPGTYTVLATIPGTGCNTLQVGSATVGVSPLPLVYSLSGGGNICVLSLGADIVLSNSEMGVNYELFIGTTTTGTILSGTGSALHFGLQTVGGVYTVVATNTTTGCMKNMSGSATITINPLPNLFNVTGGGHYCSGGTGVHIGLDGSNTSINYQLKNGSGSVGSAMAGSGTVLDFGLKTVPGAYWVEATNPLTGCVNTMTGTGTISIDPLPNDFPIIGGGPYCAGSGGDDISIGGSEVGFSYQLYRSGTPVGIAHAGTGSAIDFGVQAAAGVYTVKSTNDTTGCSKNMPGTAVVTIISNSTYAVTGGGNFCAGGTGVHVGLSGSQSGVDYQLWISSGSIGAVVHGTGSSIDFGLQTTGDIYKVIATNATYFCFDTMAGIATVNINPLPALQTVNGGGSYCFGGGGRHIGLILGDAGINYQLYNGSSAVGAPVPGGASALDFGLETVAGTYTVIGSNITTGCSNTMSGSAIITIKPLPAAYRDSVTGENPAYPGYFCATDTGVHIYLKNSDAGIKYQLWRGTTMIGSPVFSAGGILDMGLQVVAGTYTITAEDTATTCTNNMLGSAAVHIVNLPNVHNVTGGGIYCPGGTGLHVGLDGSDPGFTYQLFDGPYSAGSILYGTGAPLDFGVMTASGTYTIVGNNVITTCLNNMFGGATIAFDSILTPHVMLRAFPGTGVGVWHIDSIRADVSSAGTNPTYQWSINGNDITGATNASFTNHEFFNNDLVAQHSVMPWTVLIHYSTTTMV